MADGIDKIEAKPHFIETELERIYALYEKEQAKGSAADQEKMVQIALSVMMLLMRRSHHYDSAHSEALTLKADVQVQDVKGTYNAWAPFIVTIISSVINIGAGAVGLSALGGFAAPMVDRLSSASKGLSAVATGTDGFGKILDGSSTAQRTVYEYSLRETQRRRDDRDNTIRHGETRLKDSIKDLKDAIQSTHQAAQAVLAH